MHKSERYSFPARLLHWTVGLLIIMMLALGWIWPDMAPGTVRHFLSDVHKLVGCVVLLLAIVRVAVRLAHRPPESAPASRLQKAAAALVHLSLYVLMFAMPLSGLAILNWRTGVGFFGVRLPQLDVDIVSRLFDNPIDTFCSVHYAGAFVISSLVILHVAAALWHHFMRRDNVLRRMLPGKAAAQPEA